MSAYDAFVAYNEYRERHNRTMLEEDSNELVSVLSAVDSGGNRRYAVADLCGHGKACPVRKLWDIETWWNSAWDDKLTEDTENAV